MRPISTSALQRDTPTPTQDKKQILDLDRNNKTEPILASTIKPNMNSNIEHYRVRKAVQNSLLRTMGPINECCNPLKKAKHNDVRSNLILIQKKRNAKFKKFINLYMCKPCEKAVYKRKSDLNSISIEK
ncbi:hypothetical protein PV327_011071, partial [Microctonus hyperodae]